MIVMGRQKLSFQNKSKSRRQHQHHIIFASMVLLLLAIIGYLGWWTIQIIVRSREIASGTTVGDGISSHSEELKLRLERRNYADEKRPQMVHAFFSNDELRDRLMMDSGSSSRTALQSSPCPYNSILKDLDTDDIFPQAGKRHMVNPPVGGNVTLVCCTTTAGPINILVHDKWAPNGAARFLDMITSGYMASSIPLMRCVDKFLCQFGIHSNPDYNKRNHEKYGKFNRNIPDDPNWLPEGKEHRSNADGIKRYAKGYMAFAGSGENSRTKQLIMALGFNKFLGGGSPWEVPWGEVVGKHSFSTLDAINTEYGEHGPAQGKLNKRGFDDDMKKEFSRLDIMEKCVIVDRCEANVPNKKMS